MLHKNIALADRHAPHSFEYANAAAREAATGFVTADIGKLAWQTDDDTFWVLKATTPTWVLLGTAASAVDTYWRNNTVLAMHFDGANGSTTITDQKGKAATAYGNAHISTAQSKFGGSSAYFDGTGDYISFASNSDFSFGTGDFTVEFWLNCTRAGNVIDYASNTPNLYFDGSNNLVFYAGGASRISTSGVVANTWQHIALCRSGTSTRLFIDGTQVGSTYTDTINYSNAVPYIGSNNGGTGSITGYIDDLRITKGIARYTTNFTPPTAAFPDA